MRRGKDYRAWVEKTRTRRPNILPLLSKEKKLAFFVILLIEFFFLFGETP